MTRYHQEYRQRDHRRRSARRYDPLQECAGRHPARSAGACSNTSSARSRRRRRTGADRRITEKRPGKTSLPAVTIGYARAVLDRPISCLRYGLQQGELGGGPSGCANRRWPQSLQTLNRARSVPTPAADEVGHVLQSRGSGLRRGSATRKAAASLTCAGTPTLRRLYLPSRASTRPARAGTSRPVERCYGQGNTVFVDAR